MRIAIFTDAYHPRVSGLVSSIDEFARGFRARGHEVLIVCPSYPAARMAGVVDGPGVLRVPAGPAVVSAEDRLALPWREAEAMARIEAFKPEVIHVQTEFSIGSLGRRYGRQHDMPVVSTCHTHYEMYINNYVPFLPGWTGRLLARTVMRRLFRRDDYVVVPSRRIAEVLKGYGVEKEFFVIPTGVDEALFRPQPEEAKALRERLAARYRRLSSGPLLLYVGRIGHEKNVRLLVEAFALAAKELPEASLLMVGEGPALHDIRKIAHERGIGGRLVSTGYVERSLLPAFYTMADVFVFPSATETQGLVTIESMLCGTPVIGVDEMGTAEVMEGEAGGLLSPNEVRAFADRILRFFTEPGLKERKQAEARERGRHWTVSASCEKLEAVYRRAAAEALSRQVGSR